MQTRYMRGKPAEEIVLDGFIDLQDDQTKAGQIILLQAIGKSGHAMISGKSSGARGDRSSGPVSRRTRFSSCTMIRPSRVTHAGSSVRTMPARKWVSSSGVKEGHSVSSALPRSLGRCADEFPALSRLLDRLMVGKLTNDIHRLMFRVWISAGIIVSVLA
ncbi:hypothetical protein [Roseovarius sp. D22-M7]|uniref:hypothetical protein n=1 Tax=Roseovarius sp. D22-M7 TaxID=3127116 RepID=UPI0030103D62